MVILKKSTCCSHQVLSDRGIKVNSVDSTKPFMVLAIFEGLVWKISSALIDYEFSRCQFDHFVFVYRRTFDMMFLVVYVFDIVLTSNFDSTIQALKSHLHQVFDIKDSGPLQYFLSIEVAHSPNGIFLSQQKYVLDLFKEVGYSTCKPVDTVWCEL